MNAMLTLAASMTMLTKIQAMWPEIALFTATCVVMVVGLSPTRAIRKLCWPISAIALAIAGFLAYQTTPPMSDVLPNFAQYGKVLAAGIGLLLLLLLHGSADRDVEAAIDRGEPFDPLNTNRAEFYAFFLFSLTGLMLCAGADDLIWLFLALELVSLPTYIMVAISTRHNRSMEASVKYFFLGAMGAATFLYGFAMLYGGTGSTNLGEIRFQLQSQLAAGGLNPIAMLGLILSVLGIAFKIAAVPMHFYTPDVYQGSSSPVAAFLAFVPKSAGFFSIILLVSTVGWIIPEAGGPARLPAPLHEVLWIMAVLTMTVGNVLAILQTSLKRVLAYSSIAHSGYMLVGVVAGPGVGGNQFTSNGLAAVLFYLLTYGVMNLGCFAVIACLERTGKDGQPDEIDSFDDLRGLVRSRPILGATMVLCALGLLGFPPLVGFFAKLPLFTAGMYSGQVTLVVILGLNSAIAAFYYLRLAAAPWLESGDAGTGDAPVRLNALGGRTLAAAIAGVGVIALAFVPLTGFANHGGKWTGQAAPTAPATAAAAVAEPTGR